MTRESLVVFGAAWEDELMGGLPLIALLGLFVGSGVVTWVAGVALTKTTDSLDTRFKIGDAIGGLVLLGIAGSLPEIAVVASAAHNGHMPVIVGTLIGGLSIQTLLLVIFDFAAGKKRPLSYLAGSLELSIETLFAVAIAVMVLLATLIPPGKSVYHINPLTAALPIAWIVGLLVINKVRKVPRFNEVAEDGTPGRKHHERRKVENHPFYANKSALHVIGIFAFACVATLVAGWILEESGNAIADTLHIGTGVFAATFIAFATAIPEISTGLESIVIGDNHLAVSDIMGGNAFMLILFFLADIVAQRPVLSLSQHDDHAVFLALWGVAMMVVYAVSFILRPRRCYWRLGVDSLLTILLYVAGVLMLTRM